MIDWLAVGFSALWIFGLGVVTAALSFANHLANQSKERFGQALKTPACRLMLEIGLLLFCLGWVGSASGMTERIVWGILALLFIMRIWQGRKLSNS